jgi:hypothetical protein
VFTTSTAASAITTSILGATTTHYLKGIAGPAYNISVSAPASGNIGSAVKATAVVKDIFGNPVTFTAGAATTAAIVETAVNGTFADMVAVTGTLGSFESLVTLPTVGGTTAIEVRLGTTPTSYSTIALPVTSASTLITVSDLAAQLAAEKAGRVADKAAADAALAAALAKAATDAAAAKAAADAAALTASAELVKANAEIAKLKADAVTAKAATDKAIADAAAAHATELAKVKADNAAAIASMKDAFNKLARQWNKKNPKAKVALVK